MTESTDRPTVEQVARDAVGWLRTGPQAARLDDPRFVLLDRPLSTPWFANALRLRLHDDEAADVIETARRWFGATELLPHPLPGTRETPAPTGVP